MAPEVELRAKLTAIRRRLRWMTIEERVSWCLLPALGVALALLAVHKLDRLDEPHPLMALAVGAAFALGLAWGALRRVSFLDAACLADRKLALKERMTNAVIFADRPDASPLVPALLADAARHAEELSPAAVLPYRASRPARWSLLAAVLVAATCLAPQFPVGRTAGEMAVRQEMRSEGQRLREAAARAQEQAKAKGLARPEELAKKLEKLARELERAKLSKKEALLKSGKLAAELREAQKLAALQAGTQGMSRVAESLQDVPFETATMQEIARAAREQRADEMASKLQKLAQDLREGTLSAADRRKLADDLRQLAEAAEAGGLGDMAQALRESASALEQGKEAAAAEAMERAAKSASEAAQAAAENQTLEQMAHELEQSQQQVAQADQTQCPVHGSQCPNPQPGAGCQSGGQGAGQGSQGQQAGGQTGGKGSQTPRGRTGSFAGKGTTNEEQSGPPMPPYLGEPNMQDTGRRPKWEEKHRAIYAPERLDVQTEDRKFRGQMGQGREQSTPVRAAPERQSSQVPYYEVYEAYAREAEDAMAREDIPRAYERQVRDYFRSIQPDRETGSATVSAPGRRQ